MPRISFDVDLPTKLRARLAEPLPGKAAQRRFEPGIGHGRHFAQPPVTARPAAVLILLYPHEGSWHVPLQLRPDTLPDHPGQISLPGGVVEADESSRETALRETHEELGIELAGVEVLGKLSPLYVFNSNFAVQPWLAVTHERPDFQPSVDEVAALLEVPVEHLTDEVNYAASVHRRVQLCFSAPYIGFGGYQIWGATSMILGEFIALVQEAVP